MTYSRCRDKSHCYLHRAALTLAEVVVATLLMGTVLIGATDLLGHVVRGRTGSSDLAVGQHLAQQLMTEILSANYQDDDAMEEFGIEADEVSVSLPHDDVDDYALYSDQGPIDALDVANFSGNGWSRTAQVEWVDPNQLDTVSLTDQGLKRVTVIVQKSGRVVARLVALSSDREMAP